MTPASNRLFLVFLLLGSPLCGVHASPLEIGGYDARALGMGGAQTAASKDHTAALYNPAALTTAPASFSLGWMATNSTLSIALQRSPKSVRAQPVYPESQQGGTIGAVFPLGGGIGDRFALGIGIYTPTDYLAQGQLLSAQTPRFYRFQNRGEKFVGLGALAFRVMDGLHIGIGGQLIGDLLGRAGVDVRLSDRQVTRKNVYVEQPLKVAGIFGVLAEPGYGLRIGACWRQDINLEFSIPSQLVIDDSVGLEIDVGGVALYTPESLTLGVAWEHGSGRLQLSSEVSWVRWSQTPDPSLQLAIDISGQLVDSLGLEDRLDLRGPGGFDLAMRDVWEPRVGLEYMPINRISLRTGYAWRPSPAPVPTGAFNLIDPASHRVSAGLGLQVPNPWEEDSRLLHLDIGYSVILLQELQVQKRAGAADPVGDYRADGHVQTFSLSLKQEL